jgi:O-antigen/teichoic acid export membrane protein
VVEVFAYSIASRKFSGISSWDFGFSVPALASVWSFSLSMAALSVLGVLISQLDRLMLSKMLPLADLGYYTLAYSAASTVSLGISAISSAMLPSFTSAIGRDAMDELRVRYDDGNRVLLFIVGLIVFPLVFFGDTILTAWVGADAARGAYRPLILLALGFWCSALLSNAYSLAIASGRPGVVLRLSAASALPYFVAMFFLLREGGASGAALGWLLLNMAYVVVLVPAVHRRLLNESGRHWVLAIFVPFAALGVAVFGGARALVSAFPAGAATATVAFPGLVLSLIVYFAVAYRMLGPRIRAEISALVGIRGGRAASLER